MFTSGQIKEAHAKVKSGADFPKYVNEIARLGVLAYTTYVNDGHAEFDGTEAHKAIIAPKYEVLPIADGSDAILFKQYLKKHQQGESNYLTFCKQAAETGIEKWVVDVVNLTCTYFDKAGTSVLVETIPAV